MPSNSTNLQNNIFYRAIKFANDCGTQALGDRDFDKIREIYMKFSVDTELLFNKELDSKLSNLKEEVGKLDFEEDTEDVKYVALSDVIKLIDKEKA